MPTLDRRKSLVRCLDAVDKSPADAGGRHEVLGPLEDSCVRAELDNARRTNAKSASRRSEEHTSELQSRLQLVCRLLLEKKKKNMVTSAHTPAYDEERRDVLAHS